MRLSVVIPARNEAGNIGPTLDKLAHRLHAQGIPYEILVVDDGSTDATVAEVMERSSVDPGVRIVHNPAPHGFGRAVRRGLDLFIGDAVVITMADGSDDPGDVVRYYYVLRDGAECAFGSRWMPGAHVDNYPKLKLLINRVANTAVRWLFHLSYNDITNAFKGYRRVVIEGCRPFLSPHFNLTVEIPLKAIVRGYSYRIVPTHWQNRRVGQSSLHIEEMGSRYLYVVLIVWLEKLLTRGDYYRSVEVPEAQHVGTAPESDEEGIPHFMG